MPAALLVLFKLLGVYAGCATVEDSKATKGGRAGTQNFWGKHLWSKTVSGVIILDGRPVPYFGIAAFRHYDVNYQRSGRSPISARCIEQLSINRGQPEEIRDPNGRFTIEVSDLGDWDLVIAGPGFARHVSVVRVGFAHESKPLTIRVSRGSAIQGIVRDDNSNPVAGAVVRLTQNHSPLGSGVLAEFARGNMVTVTDKDGIFRFEGVTPVGASCIDGRANISAHQPSGGQASLPLIVATNEDTSVELTVLPVGSIEGVIKGGASDEVAIVAVSRTTKTQILGRILSGGKFYFRNLPQGEYEVKIVKYSDTGVGSEMAKSVTVRSGHVTFIEFP